MQVRTLKTPAGTFRLLVDAYQDDLLRDEDRTSVFARMVYDWADGADFADLGAGTGPLSIVAANAGARRVVAVERHPKRARLLEKNLRKHAPKEVSWEVVKADARSVEIDADVVVCEMIDTLLLEEDFVDVVNAVLERYRPRVLPPKVWIGRRPLSDPPRVPRYAPTEVRGAECLEVIRTDREIPKSFEYKTPGPGYEFLTWVEYKGRVAGGSEVFCPGLRVRTPGRGVRGERGEGLASLEHV
ncbi:MAG: methyltransferase domain-containing protein [Methanopyraceae archaeon]